MEINPHIFRGYDIRGVAGKDMDASSVELIGRAHAAYLKTQKIDKAVVGADNRLSSEEFRNAAIKGLIESGIDVIDLGMTLTSVVYWAQYKFKAKGGVMVTASHNPAEYNGCKLPRNYSDTFTPVEEIKRRVFEKDFVEGRGKLTKAPANYIQDYYKDLLSKVGKLKKFKIVIDASNGTAGKFMPELFRLAGSEVIEQNCELDGSFPNGTPDPTEKYVAKRLSERVIKEGADVGFSFDADGDRIGIVDNKGNIFWNDVLVAILADAVIAKNPGAKIVYNTLCSKIVQDVIENAGGVPILWLTGHAFIKEKAQKEKALFAGELSGHFFFLDKFYPHDDAAFAGLRVLEYITEENKTLSEIVSKYPKYVSSPEMKIGCPDNKKEEIVASIAKDFKKEVKGGKVIDLEGALVYFDDGMMIIRYSQNGPYLAIKFEAKDEKTYKERAKYISEVLHRYPEINWDEGSNLDELK